MPKRKAPELTPAEQKKRFEALAREVGADASSNDFKRALRGVAKAGTQKKPAQRGKIR
jgi:hypothetical protein